MGLGLAGLAGVLCHAQSSLADAVYFAEIGFGDTISRQVITTTLPASTTELLVPLAGSDPRGVALDVAGGKIYYAFGTSIGRANLDGTSPETVISGLAGGVGDIELNPFTGTLYFAVSSGTSADRSISRVQTDGEAGAVGLDAADAA
ncbi:MAG: hypothetical protein AAGK78_02245, partial [Planctomycetota bacterium]